MDPIVTSPQLGDLVVERPGVARVLDRFGLDYCCGGQRTLAEACQSAGVELEAVEAALEAVPPGGPEDWALLEPVALAEHIVTTHHAYLHEELPLLEALAVKVARVHGARHPELARVREVVAAVRAELEPHLAKEERVLFPAIAALAEGTDGFPFGSIAHPIRVMVAEHDRAGALLAELRTMTQGYQVPPDACASYRSLLERLSVLEEDTHLHVHKENNVLFPAALRIAERLEGGRRAG